MPITNDMKSFNPKVCGLQAARCGIHPVVIAVPEACFGLSKRLQNSSSLGMEDTSQFAARFFTGDLMTRGKGTIFAHTNVTPARDSISTPGNASISSIISLIAKEKPSLSGLTRRYIDSPFGTTHSILPPREILSQCAFQNLPRSFGSMWKNMSQLLTMS